ncbi:DNA phosphorothioation-dependent restriction protein DptG, partial [Staphylococcus pasteuri]|uniref:DNA phosphorothioation-dependent restriction protein DptG n=1 Tax=Staphylococcus pasteuri TaxID=45972 RepID=UPI000D3913AB
NKIKEINKSLLVNENLLGYLNVLVNSEYDNNEFYSFTDIFNFSQNEQLNINHELEQVLKLYSKTLNKNQEPKQNLNDNILLFKKWLNEDLSNETLSRYFLSIEEIGNLYFLKNRGSMGKTLTIKKDMLILLTAVIVKDEKLLINDVFSEFEKRGIYLDRYTKNEILNFYEKMNILDKKSDSGEIKYVKPVL